MVIALVTLSLAMIVGGLYAAFQGWEIVVLERGWSLMISGSVAAASGAVLLGVAAAVARLGALRREMAHLRERMGRAELPAMPPLASVDALSTGYLAGAPAPRVPEEEDRPDGQPTLPLFMRPDEDRVTADEAGPPPHVPAHPALPDHEVDEHPERAERRSPTDLLRLRLPGNLFKFRRGEEPEPEREAPEEAGPMREPLGEPRLRPEEEPLAPEPVSSVEPEAEEKPEKGPEPEAPKAAEPPRPPTVVGSYNAGDNRYVMFSDGSIEANTPQGVFHFDSLDELKQFIASGGERPSRP